MRNVLVLFSLFVLIACKRGQIPQSSQILTVPEPQDSIPAWITSNGDTLFSLENTFEVQASPVLLDTIKIKAVGDIMMGTHYPNPGYLPPDSGELLWQEVRSNLVDADVTFGNLEGVILDGKGEPKECKNPKACFLFKTPSHLAYHFKQAGFDLMSLANNHANDFGSVGRTETQRVLDSLNIQYAGSSEIPYSIWRTKGLSIGFAAFAPNKGTQSLHDYIAREHIIRNLDSLTDIVVISFHAGAEGAKNQHINRETEYYYGENRGNVYELAHSSIDWGADVILCHGPHVPRAIEVYQKRFIAYSLGNFLTYGRFNLRGPNSHAPILEININGSGEFLYGKIHPYLQSYTYGPQKDDLGTVIRNILELSQKDFPENPISVDENGRITYLHDSKF